MTINTGEPTIPPVPQQRNTQKTLLTQSRVEEGQMARQFLYNIDERVEEIRPLKKEKKRKPGTTDLELRSTLKDDKLEEMSQGPLNRT